MNLKKLEQLIKEGINKGELKFLCRIKTYHELDRQIFLSTKKSADDYEYLIMLPIIDKTGGRWKGVGNLYGKPV